MTRLKELEEEHRHLKKSMLSASKPKSFRRPWQKSGEAITSKADAAGCIQVPEYQRNVYIERYSRTVSYD